MSRAEEHKRLMLRFLAEADSALCKAREARLKGDLHLAAQQLRLAASATNEAAAYQTALESKRLGEAGCVN